MLLKKKYLSILILCTQRLSHVGIVEDRKLLIFLEQKKCIIFNLFMS
jgi:hypothetical protein